MNKSDIVAALSTAHPDVPAKYYADVVDEMFTIMRRFIVRGKKLNITNFGSFRATLIGERVTRNPKTGQEVYSKPRLKVQFRPAARLRQADSKEVA